MIERLLADRRWRNLLVVVAAASSAFVAVKAIAFAWHRFQLDLGVYVMGAGHLFDGRLYQAALAREPHLPFTYPPFAALAFLPLRIFGEQGGQVAWALINVLALFAVVWLSLRAVKPGIAGRDRLLLAGLLMAPAYLMEPVSLTFSFGQINLLLCAMVLADLTGELRVGRRRLPKGVLLGAAAAIKLIPLVFVAYLLITRRLRAGLVALASFAACTLLAFALSPSSSWGYWTHYAFDAGRVGGNEYISNQSLLGGFDRATHAIHSSTAFVPVELVVLVAGLALAAWAQRRSSDLLGLLLAACTAFLVSPITWAHHMVWVVPILLWLLWAEDRPRIGPVLALLGALFFFWAPIWHVPHENRVELHETPAQMVEGASYLLVTIAFLLGMTAMLWWRRHHREDPASSPVATSG